MLTVKTPDEVFSVLKENFLWKTASEMISLDEACGRVLSETIESREYVPDFDRSTVDGFAVSASDTFGCSDSIPAILKVIHDIRMGEETTILLEKGCCMTIPTGGALPEGADAVVMVEYTEDYGDGTIGIFKSAVPGTNVIFRGDDVFPGKTVLAEGRLLLPQDIGALAAMGITNVPVHKRPVVGIISTGDEIVPADQRPDKGQVRDVNSALLGAMMKDAGADVIRFGIVRDREDELSKVFIKALGICDVILISGGSSVGAKDATCKIIESQGEILFHGIAMKPGKPTILGNVKGKPVFGLPGHPVAAFFTTHLFVRHLIALMMGRSCRQWCVPAVLSESVSANHGRAQYQGVNLEEQDGKLIAHPVRSKSGLITTLAGTDGWFCIPRDSEGAAAGSIISVYMYTTCQGGCGS